MVVIIRDYFNDPECLDGYLYPLIIQMGSKLTPLEAVQLFTRISHLTQRVGRWEDVFSIYFRLMIFARYLASQEDTDAESIHTLLR